MAGLIGGQQGSRVRLRQDNEIGCLKLAMRTRTELSVSGSWKSLKINKTWTRV